MAKDDGQDPDGIPHAVVGLTALGSVALAIAVLVALSSVSRVVTAVLLMVALPVFVSALERKAERERDPLHWSR